MSDAQKLTLFSLYSQATKGDYDENANKGLLSLFYSGPNNNEKEAWKKRKGTPREVAMFHWTYQVKKILEPFSSEDVISNCKLDKTIKEKPTEKSIKQLQSYLDHFQVIYRENRHYTRSIRTETLQSVTKSQLDVSEDDGEHEHANKGKVTTYYDKKLL